MQPQQTPPPAPPPPQQSGSQNQYDFIINPAETKKRSLLPGGGDMKGRIIVVSAGAVILLLLAILVVSLLSSAGRANTTSLVEAAKQQQELIRISEIGIDKARTQQAQNLAITTKLSLSSQQAAMQAAVKDAGLDPKKVLTGSANSETDQTLTTAEQNNRFDVVFIEVMNESLSEYQQQVKIAFNSANSKQLKDALATQYDSATILVGTPKNSN